MQTKGNIPYTISEKKLNIFFLANPLTGDSQIGFQYNNDCVYQEVPLGDARCLNFNIDYPIHKVVHRITNCSTEIYWTDGLNPRRYLDLDNIPYLIDPNSDPECDPVLTGNVDCNQLKIQPNFDIPFVEVNQVVDVGSLVAGTYQFAVASIGNANADVYRFRFYKNGSSLHNYELRIHTEGGAYGTNGEMNITTTLAASDYISIFGRSDGGNNAYADAGYRYTYFRGHLMG